LLFTKSIGNHVATNIKLSQYFFVLHRVTEHLITDFACCSYLYGDSSGLSECAGCARVCKMGSPIFIL